ncbi:serine/threonine-protein phosphatase 4 regulatory subunit 1-like isoform X3 [Gigantopelta aegis]|uniref:serine/threonine-protein phosphatase 4 regulatory subunit 1-like isoform X3 n=1 Tax=Gigantopelta aegis TaxID=1735272 RepID=UPI001B887EF9|nr:serine/threonine-protein phosphatase 4 regulatory subunit 1-like isoform X3 [Gigantopelta aegis]
MVARGLLDTLRTVAESNEDAMAVLKAMVKLSEDQEPSVRSELMEQVPHIAVYCQENQHIFADAIPTYVLSMVVRYLNDCNNQVRKTSQAALLVLLEQELVRKEDIEEQVVNVILDLSSPDSLDDYRTEAVALMSKMAPLLGKDITERLFLPRFSEMCTDPLFHVRKVCAANFGEVSAVVGCDNTEEHLLPKFFYLCEDGVWGVRKACAECFMNVSCSCSLDIRRHELANLFVNLLCDQSRWVRMAAFQQLGPFISTFADPRTTGLFVNEDGSLFFRNPDGTEGIDMDEESIRKAAKEALGCDIDSFDEQLSNFHNTCEGSTETMADLKLSEEIMDLNISDDSDLVETDFSEILAVDNSDDTSFEERRAEMYTEKKNLLYEPTVEGKESEIKEVDSNRNKICDKDSDTNVCDSNSSNAVSDGPSESASVESAETDAGESDNTTASTDTDLAASVADATKGGAGTPLESTPPESSNDQPRSRSGDGDQVQTFNAFQFWRPPFPSLDVDFDLVDGAPYHPNVITKFEDQTSGSSDVETGSNEGGGDRMEDWVKIHTASVSTFSEEGETVDNIGSTHILGQQINDVPMAVVDGIAQDKDCFPDLSTSSIGYIDSDRSISPHESPCDDATLAQQQLVHFQDVIPESLLENYLGMVDASRAQTVDTEITRHCAYNLPAVAYTLGRQNWHCIKNLYEKLAQDMQWKVRRTLAFSLHEMAVILGEEITHKDLVPVFEGFLKDLDEVRIGILKHLADFVRLLKPDVRRRYLGRIQDFMTTDNHRNWRFRLELSQQLVSLCELYSTNDITRYLVPIAMNLASDKVAEVRHIAFRLISIILRRLYEDGEENLTVVLVRDLVDQFAMSSRWLRRQNFAQCCRVILEENSLPPSIVVQGLLPPLLALGTDAIPNVRLSAARVLAQNIVPSEFYTSQKNPHHEDLLQILQKLQADNDRDVRYFVTKPPETDISLDTVPV